jgi:hypothetical protein
MSNFLSGAVMLACSAVALLFLRSWQRTSDRLFGLLALAFFLLAVERWVLALLSAEHQLRHLVYLIRLVAFLLILIAIVDKNRASPGSV